MASFTLRVNGASRVVEAHPDTPLLWILRDTLGLTGVKYGCGEGVCGACTVHEGGRAARSCLITVAQAAGREYVTIEGLSTDGRHPCQVAWLEDDVAQCGYCQPGMIMEMAALLERAPRASDRELDEALSSHLCRCGTYNRLRAASRRAASLAASRS